MKHYKCMTCRIALANIFVLFFSSFLCLGQIKKDAYDIGYFMPQESFEYDKNIPQPKDILGFELGELHADGTDVDMDDYMLRMKLTKA